VTEPTSPDRPLGLNRLRAMWAEGCCALGAIATIPSVQVAQVLAAAGLDFILIDMEHRPTGPAEAHAMIAATAGTPLHRLAIGEVNDHGNCV
jgi:4-hydroxy-2-oxoheptanedioate aldolase